MVPPLQLFSPFGTMFCSTMMPSNGRLRSEGFGLCLSTLGLPALSRGTLRAASRAQTFAPQETTLTVRSPLDSIHVPLGVPAEATIVVLISMAQAKAQPSILIVSTPGHDATSRGKGALIRGFRVSYP